MSDEKNSSQTILTHDDGIISGYASVFNVTDAYGDVVEKGAFSNAVKAFNCGKKPKMLWQHDTHCPIGTILEMYEDNYGLFIKSQLILELPQVRDIFCLLKNKAINGFSIGYRTNKKYHKNGKQYLKEIDLLEVSVVTFPACESAIISNVKNDGEKIMDKEIQNVVNELNENINNYMQSSDRQIEERRRNTMNCTLPKSNQTTMFNKRNDFKDYIRAGIENFSEKSLDSDTNEHGGFFIPQEITNRINDKLKYLSPMRAISKVMTISTNSVDVIVDFNCLDAGWSGNDPTRLETDTPELKKITIPVHEVYAKPKASQQLLDDAKIDVEEWLINKIAEKFASLENHAFICGKGADKPKGFTTYASKIGEKREFGELQHFVTGAKGKFVDADSALNILVDMVCSIKPIYVKNAKWLMSRSALAEIRKLKNADGVNLWQPSMSESLPSTLLGYPVIIDDDMPALKEGEESTSIAFGDFYTGYQIVDRQELTILRDPYSSKPFVEFYATKRIGGAVVDFDAIKLLKFSEE